MAAQVKVSKKKVDAAIFEGRGIKTEIAKKLKISRQTLDNYLKRWPDLVPKLADARETIIDSAEIGLEKLIKRGDVRAIIFTLETIGRNRGYQKRTEITGADGRPVIELSPELALLMAKLGISGADVVRSLETELKVAAGAAS
jgi:hypothetical protein